MDRSLRIALLLSGLAVGLNQSLPGHAAEYAMGAGLSFLRRYSDTWADPGKPFLPQAWEGKTHSQLVDAVLEYTPDTMAVILLVEVAYCWRPTEYRTRPGPFPETPEGQRAFLEEVHRLVRNTPNGRGRGAFWWEPAVTGRLRSRGFFDDGGDALPVITVFDRWTRR